MTIHWTDDGGVEFIAVDSNGDERKVKFRPNDDGTFDIVTHAPDGTSKKVTIDPGGGSTALGQ